MNDINLTIKRGEIFGIIGLSGAGKSTLVRCINYLEEPTEGNVIFEDRDLGKLKKKDLLLARRSMAMIFQNFNLLSQRNALQNVCFPMEIAGVPKAVELSDRVVANVLYRDGTLQDTIKAVR